MGRIEWWKFCINFATYHKKINEVVNDIKKNIFECLYITPFHHSESLGVIYIKLIKLIN